MGRLLPADRNTTVTQITSHYNDSMHMSVSEADGPQHKKTTPVPTAFN